MIELVKEEVSKLFPGITWESMGSHGEDYGCNLPEVMVFMGLKDCKGLIIAFSKELLKSVVASELGCDEALISESEMVEKAKELSLNLVRSLYDRTIPYPVVVKGNFMELMIHKASFSAYCGSLGRNHIFIGVVEPIEE